MTDPCDVQINRASLERITTLSLKDGGTCEVSRIAAPISSAKRERLGALIADMDPWKRYGFKPAALARFFEPFDRSMPRFVVTIGDEVVGMFALKIGWMFGMYLNVLAVFPTHQGRGIGSAVLSWLEERGRANGDRNQFVVTSAFNCGGLRLYKRHGFEPVAELPGLINETETEILLRKRL